MSPRRDQRLMVQPLSYWTMVRPSIRVGLISPVCEHSERSDAHVPWKARGNLSAAATAPAPVTATQKAKAATGLLILNLMANLWNPLSRSRCIQPTRPVCGPGRGERMPCDARRPPTPGWPLFAQRRFLIPPTGTADVSCISVRTNHLGDWPAVGFPGSAIGRKGRRTPVFWLMAVHGHLSSDGRNRSGLTWNQNCRPVSTKATCDCRRPRPDEASAGLTGAQAKR